MIRKLLFPFFFSLIIGTAHTGPIKNMPDAAKKSRQAVPTNTFEDILAVNAEKTNLFEGDIVLASSRNAVADKSTRWEATIPYVINEEYSYERRAIIVSALNELEVRTCLTFVERTTETDYILYKIDDGCFSNVGRVGGKQIVSIGNGCDNHRTVIHETLHALGFYHEQSRTDRDDYVTIVWDVISDGNGHNFNKYDSSQLDTQDVPYDYDSIMHYHDTAFSKNGSKTIIAPAEKTDTMGKMEAMSQIDVEELNKLYECQVNIDSNGYTQWSDWGLCDQSCIRTRQRFCDGQQCTTWGAIQTESEACDESCEVDHDPDCGPSIVQGNVGTVASPLYPYSYKSNAECIQTIKTPTGSRVRLDFQDMDIEHVDGECYYDFLHIYDGPDDSSPEISTYCGDTLPVAVFASGNVLTLQFISDYSVVQNGYFAKFNAIYGNSHFCAFENPKDLCGWTTDSSVELTFRSNKGSTGSADTGPSTDHTFGSTQGQYLYLETSSPATAGQRARIISPSLHANSEKSCFSVWYNMYGINTGSLSIYMGNDNGTISSTAFHVISGDKGDDLWYQLAVTITKSPPFKVAIEAVRGNGYRGDIGIDDVTLNPGECP